ncbi:hypothetical protein GWI33_003267 [Rhynchophorus ferrugineus]|uniref:Uncharacterized protein n=1 Tax=Rhynchophorus ferrugineus TaxID=354439 RepID=A0A834HJF2_RHYFE|nr:hypothetical protein GWI33_003267 [Rhynchophorus ferrugineus]
MEINLVPYQVRSGYLLYVVYNLIIQNEQSSSQLLGAFLAFPDGPLNYFQRPQKPSQKWNYPSSKINFARSQTEAKRPVIFQYLRRIPPRLGDRPSTEQGGSGRDVEIEVTRPKKWKFNCARSVCSGPI